MKLIMCFVSRLPLQEKETTGRWTQTARRCLTTGTSGGKGKDAQIRAARGEWQRRRRWRRRERGPRKWRMAGRRWRPRWSLRTVLSCWGRPRRRWRRWTTTTRARPRRPDCPRPLLVLITFTAACRRSARGPPAGRAPWDWWTSCRIGTLRPWARTTSTTAGRTRGRRSTAREGCISTVECTTTRLAAGRADSSTATSTTASASTAWSIRGKGQSYRSRFAPPCSMRGGGSRCSGVFSRKTHTCAFQQRGQRAGRAAAPRHHEHFTGEIRRLERVF